MADDQTNSSQAGSSRQSGLSKLMDKYGTQAATYVAKETAREGTRKAFEMTREIYESDKASLRRMSSGPKSRVGGDDTATIYRNLAEVKLNLAELNETYNALNVGWRDLIGTKGIDYTWGETAKLFGYSLMGAKKRKKAIKLDAATRKGTKISTLTDRIASVVLEQREEVLKGKETAKGIQKRTVAHMKHLDTSLVDNLKASYVTTADLAEAQKEVDSLKGEIEDINAVLLEYEGQVNEAKQINDINEVKRLTGEMEQVLVMKRGVLEGHLGAKNVEMEIRREILNAADGVQSAKGAIANTDVTYTVSNSLLDSMHKLEIKYDNFIDHHLEVLKLQGELAAAGELTLEAENALLETAKVNQDLMDVNIMLVTHLAKRTSDLLQTDLADPERAMAAKEELESIVEAINQNDLDWAANVSTARDLTLQSQQARYVVQQ